MAHGDTSKPRGGLLVVAAVVTLTLTGIWLIFDGSSPPEPASGVPIEGDRTAESAPAPAARRQPTPPGDAFAFSPPSSEPMPSDHPDQNLSSVATPSRGEADPQGHGDHWPTEQEIAEAARPDLGGPFRTDISPELASELVDVAWTWLRPVLEERGWTHLELLQAGATMNLRDAQGQTIDATVTVGYTGVDAIGSVGSGRAAEVTVSKVDGVWQVTGLREWTPA